MPSIPWHGVWRRLISICIGEGTPGIKPRSPIPQSSLLLLYHCGGHLACLLISQSPPDNRVRFTLSIHLFLHPESHFLMVNFTGSSTLLSELQQATLLCRLRSIAAHRDHFVRRLSVCACVCLSDSHTSLIVTHSYVSQATHAFLGMLPLCCMKFDLFTLQVFMTKIS